MFYETTDICIASYLRLKGKQLVSFSKISGTQCVFKFEDATECKRLSVEFINSEVQTFYSEVKNLKRLTYNSRI